MAGPLALVGVPTSAGTHGPGQEKAPGALRAAGLVRALEAAGVEVHDEGDLPVAMYKAAVADPRQRDLEGVVEVAGRVADRVAEVLGRGMTPLVLGGDCTITLGVAAGFARHTGDLGLLYFDGDADLSTPATTGSGVLDSMVVAHLLGEGAPALAQLGPRVPLLPSDRLLLFGFDDPDDLGEAQQPLLARHGPTTWPASRTREAAGGPRAAAAAALGDLEARAGTVVVHFDVDVVDTGDLPLANFPHFNQGLTLADAVACLEVFCGSGKLGGVVVTEVNPDHDPDGTQLGRLVDGLAAALARRSPAPGG
ncbi:MAG TPA: arginase family protein [Actinomycetota bacterium]|nr:arginase family protein [Actinomycetota bacterium]